MESLSATCDSQGNSDFDLEAANRSKQMGNVRYDHAPPPSNSASYLSRESGEKLGTVLQGPITADADADAEGHASFSIGRQQLVTLMKDSNPSALQQEGGVERIGQSLKTDLKRGIRGDQADLTKRKLAYGSNTYPRKQAKTFLRLLWEASNDPLHITLMLFAVAFMVEAGVKQKGLHEGWSDGVSIAAAIVIFTFVKAILQNYTQSLLFLKSNQENSQTTIKGFRSGKEVDVPSYGIVVGDVLVFKPGDDVLFDCIIINSESLLIDEFNITGASYIVSKNSVKAPFLKAGSRVEEGECTVLVTCVGINTQYWSLHPDEIPVEDKVAPLQVCILRVATAFTWPGIVAALIFVAILLVRLFTGRIRNAAGIPAFIRGKTRFQDAIFKATQIALIGGCILMIGVPEGFPLLVPLSVACLIEKMVKEVVVRNIPAFASMASTTTICFNRTGTSTLIEDADQVRLLRNAGVQMCMMTRENLETARGIALECGILGSDESEQFEPNVIEGSVFRAKTESEREQIADKIRVMSQASPRDKLQLVEALRRTGKVVAFVGHDRSDAHALRQADISITSIGGTPFAQHNSDIILQNDSFASVAKVIRSGRAVYANIQKILVFQLPVNIAAITFNTVAVFHCDVPLIGFVAAVSSCSVPISAVQILWVNFFIITIVTLALVKEHPTADLMRRPPIDLREFLITNRMWTNILLQAVYQVTVLLILDYQGWNIMNLKHDTNDQADKLKNTVMFNAFVLCQIFNAFNARNDEYNNFKGIVSNFVFIILLGVAVVAQVLVIEFLHTPFGTVKLNRKYWLISVGIGFISWPLAVAGKMLPVPPFTKLWTAAISCGEVNAVKDEVNTNEEIEN